MEFIKKHRKFLIIIGVLLALFLVARTSIFKPKGNGKTRTFVVTRGDVESAMVLSGEVDVNEKASLQFPNSGQLAWVGVKEGDSVVKGQALAKQDTTQLDASNMIAWSNYRETQATVEKVHDDIKGHSGDETFAMKETRTIAEVANDNAYAAVLKSQKNLEDANLFSPINGVVTSVKYKIPGPVVFPTDIEVEIVNPNTLYFSAKAEQTETNNIKVGQKVNISLDAFPEKTFPGHIVSIGFSPKANETETVYEVKVAFDDFDNSDMRIRVGMTGDLKIILSTAKGVLYAPPVYVKSTNGTHYVIVGKDKRKVNVNVGVEGDERVEISGDGISEGTILND
jgi:RND family efflux transporter MFP subunit